MSYFGSFRNVVFLNYFSVFILCHMKYHKVSRFSMTQLAKMKFMRNVLDKKKFN